MGFWVFVFLGWVFLSMYIICKGIGKTHKTQKPNGISYPKTQKNPITQKPKNPWAANSGVGVFSKCSILQGIPVDKLGDVTKHERKMLSATKITFSYIGLSLYLFSKVNISSNSLNCLNIAWFRKFFTVLLYSFQVMQCFLFNS